MLAATILPGTADRVQAAFDLLCACRDDLNRQGIYQWHAGYPTVEVVQKDVDNGHLYCFSEGSDCCGIIVLSETGEPEYAGIEWDDRSGPALVVHRLAVLPQHQNRGIAGQLMDFAEDLAVRTGCRSIRLDAYSGNENVLRFYKRRGYGQKVGTLYFPGRTLPFYGFEKRLPVAEDRPPCPA